MGEGYDYDKERSVLFTDDGQRAFLRVRDFVQCMLREAGAVSAGRAMEQASGLSDSWSMMACVDRLVELGEVRDAVSPATVAWQHRVLVKA